MYIVAVVSVTSSCYHTNLQAQWRIFRIIPCPVQNNLCLAESGLSGPSCNSPCRVRLHRLKKIGRWSVLYFETFMAVGLALEISDSVA
jgi:hypothetical protein